MSAYNWVKVECDTTGVLCVPSVLGGGSTTASSVLGGPPASSRVDPQRKRIGWEMVLELMLSLVPSLVLLSHRAAELLRKIEQRTQAHRVCRSVQLPAGRYAMLGQPPACRGCMCVHVCACACVHVRASVCGLIHACTCVCACACVCVYVNVYVYVYVTTTKKKKRERRNRKSCDQ